VAINLEFENYRSVIDFIQNEKSLLFTETFNEIKKSIKNDDEMANVANLIVNDEVIVINIDKKDWPLHLNYSIEYFESVEDYETCIEISNVVKNL
jgi:hypothetical protein